MKTHGWICALAAAVALAACETRVEVDEPADEPAAERPAPPAERPERTEPTLPSAPPDEDAPPDEIEGPDQPFEGTTDPTVRESPLVGNVVLDAVRTAQRSGHDRMVFQFREGERPGYQVRFSDPPVTHCASGQELEVEGRYFLEVNLLPSAAHAFDDDDHREATIEDTDRQVGYRNVRQVKMTCDHHGGVTWVLGMRHRQEYRIFELSDPARIVIDVRNDPVEGG